jgi:hypothetical protein
MSRLVKKNEDLYFSSSEEGDKETKEQASEEEHRGQE